MKNESENKFTLALLRCTKENIIENKKPLYNPIYLHGANSKDRFRIFFVLFDKAFNKQFKGQSKYISCKKISIEDKLDKDKKMIIIEDIDYLVGNEPLQEKIYNWLTECLFDTDTQVILCSDEHVDNLDLNEHLKCRIKSGITSYLK